MMHLQSLRFKPIYKIALKTAIVLSSWLTAYMALSIIFIILNRPAQWDAFQSFSFMYWLSAGMVAWTMVDRPERYPRGASVRSRFLYLLLMSLFYGFGSLLKDGHGWDIFIAGATGGFFGTLHGILFAKYLIDRWGLAEEVAK
jgi:hypothetical protein